MLLGVHQSRSFSFSFFLFLSVVSTQLPTSHLYSFSAQAPELHRARSLFRTRWSLSSSSLCFFLSSAWSVQGYHHCCCLNFYFSSAFLSLSLAWLATLTVIGQHLCSFSVPTHWSRLQRFLVILYSFSSVWISQGNHHDYHWNSFSFFPPSHSVVSTWPVTSTEPGFYFHSSYSCHTSHLCNRSRFSFPFSSASPTENARLRCCSHVFGLSWTKSVNGICGSVNGICGSANGICGSANGICRSGQFLF